MNISLQPLALKNLGRRMIEVRSLIKVMFIFCFVMNLPRFGLHNNYVFPFLQKGPVLNLKGDCIRNGLTAKIATHFLPQE